MEQLELFNDKPKRKRRQPLKPPQEYKIVSLRDCPIPERMAICETPTHAADYWRAVVATGIHFNPDIEVFVVLFLNTRRRIKGHQVVAQGSLDMVQVHPREVFRAAVVSATHSIVIMHNHPSGDPLPSEADIKVTRELLRAGHLLKIEVLDHVIVGATKHISLRELGYFHSS